MPTGSTLVLPWGIQKGNRNRQNKQTYGHLQEYAKFKVFTDSLLSRASKISDLINQLESVFSETGKPDDGQDASRLKKPETQFQSTMGQ